MNGRHLQMNDYSIGRVIFGTGEAIARAYEAFCRQIVDDERPAEVVPALHRTTLAREIPVEGVGTFEGRCRQTLTFAPSARPGWWIRRLDLPDQLDTQIDIANLWTSAQNLVMRSGSPHNYLRMVEHIIALKLGLGLDDVLLKVRSGDPPLFEESSLPLVKAVNEAGIVERDDPASFVTVKEPLAFGGSRGDFLLFFPDDGSHVLHIDCAITWNSVIGAQRIRFDVTPEIFAYASLARTNATRKQYILAKTVGKLFASTRHWGYNERNILIHGKSRFYTEPRFPKDGKFLEPVWHRATLDLMAALALTGSDRFCGTVVSYRAGHTLDCDAVRALYRQELLKTC